MAEQPEVDWSVGPRAILTRQLRERAAKLDATEFMPGWRDVMEEAFPEIDAWYAEHPIVVNTPKMPRPRLEEGLSADVLRYIEMARLNRDTLKGALAQSIADTLQQRERDAAKRWINSIGGPVRLGP